VLGALVSGSLLFGMLVMVSRVDRFAWLAFALAAGVALVLGAWPHMAGLTRCLIASIYGLFFLTCQVGPWMHVGDRVGIDPRLKHLAELYDRNFDRVQLLAMAVVAIWLIVKAVQDRRRPWFSLWFLLMMACGLLVLQYSGPDGAPNDFAARLAAYLHISMPSAEAIVIAVRKTIHFAFYGLFAFFAVKAGICAGAPWHKALWSGVAFALMHAVFDESRQAFSAGRSGSFWDVLLDAAGMAIFVLLLSRRGGNPASSKPSKA